ncbi:MAG: hypothetical protein GY856_43500 [bacterium]|nr:hypothetical protein [bacterium]
MTGAAALVCPGCLLILVHCGSNEDPLTSDLNDIMREFDSIEAPNAAAEASVQSGALRIRRASVAELEGAGLRTGGMVVEGSGSGLEAGDIIAFVNEEPASDVQAFSELLQQAGNGTASLLVYRKGLPRRLDAQASVLLAAIGQRSGGPRESGTREELMAHGSEVAPGQGLAAEEQVPPEDEFAELLGQIIVDAVEDEGFEVEDTEYREPGAPVEAGDDYGYVGGPSGYDDPGTVGEDIQALIVRLRHPEAVERMQAAMEIAEFGSEGVVAIPALLDAMKDPESTVRMAAAIGIGGIGAEPPTSQAVSALIRLLRDPAAAVRVEAARSLSAVWLDGSNMSKASAALEKALGDSDDRVRDAAAESLDVLGL